MHKFTVIAGSGHCGTKWLATVLNEQKHMTCYHELRQAMVKMAWPAAAKHPPASDIYQDYYRKLMRELAVGEVGDANSWAPFELPLLHQRVLIQQVIYLVRNGIQQLHSLMTQSAVWKKSKLTDYAYNNWLRQFWHISGKPFKPYEEWTRFERLCLLVRANADAPEWLNAHNLPVKVVRLEDLTTDVERLSALVKLPEIELEEWQALDINRKVEGNRHPNWLWQKWSRSKKEDFTRICGPAMERLGYELPS